MIEITAISAALNSLKAAGEIAKALIGIRDAEAFRNQAIQLQGIILDTYGHAAAAYAAQIECAKRVDELERELTQVKDWAAQKERYELKELHAGSLAFALKPTMQRGEPMHYACPACMQKREISIMQGSETSLGIYMLECPACKLEIVRGVNADWRPG